MDPSTRKSRIDSVPSPRVDPYTRPRLDSVTKPRVDSFTRSRLDSVTRPSGGSFTRPRLDSSTYIADQRSSTEVNSCLGATVRGITFNLGEDGSPQEEPEHVNKYPALFCEMTELKVNKKRGNGEPEWRETARWVKFEEDVEEGGNRWSKPFVASLPLYSLLELRSYLSTGWHFLDLESSNLYEVWTEVTNSWVSAGLLPAELREIVLAVLLQRPKHLNQRRIRSSNSKDQDILKGKSFSQFFRNSSSNLLERSDSGYGKDRLDSVGPRQTLSAANLEDLSKVESKPNMHFFKKLPVGSEAANIMVAELEILTRPLYAFIRFRRPTYLGNLTEVPVPSRFIFVLLAPKTPAPRYYQIGRTMGTLFSDELFQRASYKAKDRTDILAAMDEFLEASTVLPPGEWDPNIRIEPPAQVQSQESRLMDKLNRENSVDALQILAGSNIGKPEHGAGIHRTGRLFGGIINDIKTKLPFYLSDFRDALHMQCLASFIFLYFASMTPLITFGGLSSDLLNRRMGAVETIVGRAISGVIWGLTAGQPVVILGSTGPILVFEVIIFNMCENLGLEYLTLRVWIGFWAMIMLLLMVAFDLSSLVSYITRFTEESFAALVSAIFVYEAFKKLLYVSKEKPPNVHPHLRINRTCECLVRQHKSSPYSILISGNLSKADCYALNNETANTRAKLSYGCIDYVPDAFLLSIVLFFGTFLLAKVLKEFKVSSYFPSRLRQVVSDFAVIISIAVFVGMDYGLGIPTPKLSVPDNFEPTYPSRNGSWIVPFFGKNEWWSALLAIVPAFLATILIFMDQQITSVIVNRKENRFRKGKGYHLDLFVVALLTGLLSLLGMPWMVADTVLSLTHVTSLRMESEAAAPGERPTFMGVREQRVTNIAISIVIGASIFMTGFLKFIPMPVLFGVFLFMGLNALNGLQFTDRLKLVFMPLKHQPDYAYLRHIPIKRIHIYTLVQLLCLVILWLLKSFDETAMLFPLMVGALVGVRRLLDYIFSQYELSFLDDVMPEHVKRNTEDKQKRQKDGHTESATENGSSPPGYDEVIKVQLPNGNFLSIPKDRSHKLAAVESDPMNFTEAVNQTGLWKNISSANLLAQVNEVEEHKESLFDKPVRWNNKDVISQEEKEGLSSGETRTSEHFALQSLPSSGNFSHGKSTMDSSSK